MFNLATFAAFAASVAAVPLTGLPVEVRQSSTVTDADILQYALTLEHLENAFYTKALQMWPETQFIAEGGSVSLLVFTRVHHKMLILIRPSCTTT